MAVTYILLCANNEYYVGSTSDIKRRLEEHQSGRGADFTKGHLPVKLVYTEEYPSIKEAYKRERQLHGWSRAKKEALIRGDIVALKQLSKKKLVLSPSKEEREEFGSKDVGQRSPLGNL